jgi:putative ABC transport system permease protein
MPRMNARPPGPARTPLRGPAALLLRALLPYAERDEVLADLAEEHNARARASRLRARLWLWRQVLGSVPALVRRTWWRGWTGFEPRASRLHSGGPIVESWIIDLRYAVRRLVSRPTYTLLAVLTLSLGVGGTAAVFSVVRALLLDPLPVAREAQVGVLWMAGAWTEQEFLHLRPDWPGFSAVAAFHGSDGATLEQPDRPMRLLPGITASAELFEVLGAAPLLGRTFQPGDDRPGAEPVAVISHRLWRELGADPAIVGRPLRLGGVDRAVVGVMPPGFWFPSPTTEVWVARTLREQREVGELELIGRVAEGMRLDGMQGPLDALVARLSERFQYPSGEWDKTRAPAITPVRDYLVGAVRPGLLATFAAMAVILLIACVNVAALMLGQVGSRATEMAVRTALGAGRQRLVRHLVAEALVLGLLAGAAGAMLSTAGFRLLLASLPLGALAETATLDWTLFWTALAVAIPAALAIALVPAALLWRADPGAALATTRTAGMSARGGRLEGGLVVAQIALAVLLSAGAALLVRSVMNLHAIDPGVDVTAVAVVDVMAPTETTADQRRRAYVEALESLRALPGVRAAAATQRLPMRGSSDNWGVGVEGRPDLTGVTTAMRIVTPEYFDALGIRLRAGRRLLPTDREDTERVVVVNETLARQVFGGEDPIGRVLHTGFDERGERIVGVVADVAEAKLTDPPGPARYMLYAQVPGGILPGTTFVLRASSEAEVPALVAAARATLARAAPRLAVHRVGSLRMVFDEAVGPVGRVVTLVTMLAVLAMVLGTIGVYGMISHFVTRRTREYGIRIALGLSPAELAPQVVRQGLRLVVLGAAAGALAAVASTRLLGSLLYGVAATDLAALGMAVAALLLAGALAALLPARRASRTDPAIVLRES